LDTSISIIPDAPRKPTASSETTGLTPKGNLPPQEPTSWLKTAIPTPSDNTDAPLDSGTSDGESGDDYSIQDDSWDEDLGDDN